MAKSWQEKFDNGRAPHVTVLDAPYAGVKAGGTLFIASPALIDRAVRTVRRGRTRTVEQLRNDLAAENRADGTCPLTTGIFLRIVSERALEQVANGASMARVTPFWRVIDPESPLARKLSCGPAFVREQREAEQRGASRRS